jgi:O-antigen/teichoic acid export membrane protein
VGAPALIVGGWWVMHAVWRPAAFTGPVDAAIGTVALFLVAAVVMTVALAATRAFGGVLPFNAIGNVAVPVLRPLALLAVLSLGGGSVAAAASWAVPWAIGMTLALWVLFRLLIRSTVASTGTWLPDWPLLREVFTYSLPRTLMAGLEQTVIWVDVVLVGAILGSTAAGVYGSAARFVAAGIVVLTALRIVVAPRFSALLAERRVDEVELLYSVTARWILLLGAPIYLVLAVYAPTVLGWLGPGFQAGVPVMVTLSLGSILLLAAGNVQSLLLMSGRSSWGAFNKLVVVVFNVGGNLLLIPRWGIEGAALIWAASMALDTALATWQVHRATGIALAIRSVAGTVLAVATCVAVPSLAVAVWAGQGTWQFGVSVLLGGVVLLCYCIVDRKRLRLDELVRLRRS